VKKYYSKFDVAVVVSRKVSVPPASDAVGTAYRLQQCEDALQPLDFGDGLVTSTPMRKAAGNLITVMLVGNAERPPRCWFFVKPEKEVYKQEKSNSIDQQEVTAERKHLCKRHRQNTQVRRE
jgi:hypothetical protein